MTHRIGVLVVVVAAVCGATAVSAAGGLNDPDCELDPSHPHPVILVHGRGGDMNQFGALVAALEVAGYCPFATNYGQTDGVGPYGHDHLTVSGAEIDAFIHDVLRATGADQVDVIGYSAGTGVLNNVILERGRGYRIHRFVSLGGLHHPYAHAGASGFADATLFLPNLIDTARIVAPELTAQQVIVWAIETYAGLGGSLAGIDVETATSNFAADLFEPDYWRALHGNLSEPPGTYITFGASRRSLATNDSVPEVCYTNIVGIADLLAGASAGFQDEAPNVDNFLLLSLADHVQLLGDPIAIGKTLGALAAPCEPSWPDDDGPVEPGDDDPASPPTDDEPPPGEDDGAPGGVTATGCGIALSRGAPGAWLLVAAIALVLRRTRR